MFVERHRYRYSRVRFFEREHGTEFLRFEMDQMRRFAAARKARGDIELDGYVAWMRPPYFVLFPAPTVSEIHLVCRAGYGVPYPDMNAFSTVKGKIGPDILPDRRIGYVLQAEGIGDARPGFGQIAPEISHKDFVGLLFEKWRNVAETTQQLIAHTLTSSPGVPCRRTGGFTVTIDALTKSASLGTLASDLRRFMPSEVRTGRPLTVRLPEMGANGSAAPAAKLPPLEWGSTTAQLERMPAAVDAKLDRIPGEGGTAAEHSITLLKKAVGPLPLGHRGVRMSDYPAVIEEHVERRSYSYDTSAEVFKFLLAARMRRPTVSAAAFEASIEEYHAMLKKFIGEHEYLSAATGSGQFLDMGHGGRPLSVYNMAASLARSRAADCISGGDFERAGATYLDNLKTIFDVIHDGAYDSFSAEVSMKYDERRMFVYIDEHPRSSAADAAAALGITADAAGETLVSLYNKSLLYEPAIGRYAAIPITTA